MVATRVGGVPDVVSEAGARLEWGGLGALGMIAFAGWLWPEERNMPKVVSMPTFAVAANVAAMVAGLRALRGELDPHLGAHAQTDGGEC